jgi:hypothetical protein
MEPNWGRLIALSSSMYLSSTLFLPRFGFHCGTSALNTQLPPSGPFVSESRDGVLLEEDLALRALVPQWTLLYGANRRIQLGPLDRSVFLDVPILNPFSSPLWLPLWNKCPECEIFFQ